jgi:hypothetical protein
LQEDYINNGGESLREERDAAKEAYLKTDIAKNNQISPSIDEKEFKK